MIKAVLFDIDGTLLDTRAFIFQAFRHVFDHYHVPYPETTLAGLMGKPLEEVYQIVLPHIAVTEAALLHRDFQVKNIHLVEAFPGTVPCLLALRQAGINTAAVTTRKRSGLQSLEKRGVAELLDAVITGDDVTEFKPHPEALIQALARLAVAASSAVMVGDSDVDIMAGKRAQTYTVGVMYGFSTREVLEKCKPDGMIDELTELLSLIENW